MLHGARSTGVKLTLSEFTLFPDTVFEQSFLGPVVQQPPTQCHLYRNLMRVALL
jgi:hypothetical protein